MIRRLARVAAAAVIAAVTLGGISASLWVAAADRASLLGPAMSAAVVVAFAAAGAVVVFARPGNRTGWVMVAGGVAWALGNAGADLAYRGIVAAPHSIAAATAWGIAGSAIRGVGWFAVIIAVPMVFPDGRVPATRWHWLPTAVAAAIACDVLGVLFDTDANLGMPQFRNPLAPPGGWQIAAGAVSFLALAFGAAAAVGCIAALRRRWQQGGPLVRQQLLLFAAAVVPPIAVGPITLATGVGGWLFSASVLPLPAALGFAMLVRGLYDLKTAANRSLVWLTLSALVVGVYALVLAGVGSLLHDRGAIWLPWLAACVVAVCFAPLRDVLQRGVNRIIFGRWDEPYQVLAALGQRLEATADADRLLADVVTELEEGLGLANVAITDRQGRLLAGRGGAEEQPGPQRETASPQTHAPPSAITLTAYGSPTGTLSYRTPAGALRSRDIRLLDDLAGHLGGLVHARQLTDDLRRARERLVLGREEERRRLRRDLHDGLGAALAGHVLRIEALTSAAQRPASATGDRIAASLEALHAEMADTVSGIRRLVDGLRPAALDQLGLGAAITQAVRRLTAGTALGPDIAIGKLPPLPAAIEVAAFRITTEAVTNVLRHADAATCSVGIEASDDRLRITVRDDGSGDSQPGGASPGHGIDSMRERAEELNGSLRIERGVGTTVIADLPLAAAPARDSVAPEPAGAGST
jgi:signal transduction histidine kinase